MKKFLLCLVIILGAYGLVSAQPSTVTANKVKAGTRGTCASGTTATPVIVDSGIFYICVVNVWTPVGPNAASSITIGTSPIVSGTTTRLLYDNAGVAGEVSAATWNGSTLTLTSPTVTAAAAGVSLTVTGTAPSGVSSGTGTAAGNVMTVAGPAGGASSSTTANDRGGAGSNSIWTLGNGGAQTGAASGSARGGTGGGFIHTAGNGGNATAVTGTVGGGVGGGVTFTAGNGGTSATSTGGTAGNATFTAGTGGVTTATAVSGTGGTMIIAAGPGGANATSGGTAGNGGGITIDAGAAGAASGGASTGSNGGITIGTTNAAGIMIGNFTASTITTIKSPQIVFSNTAYLSCTALTTNGSGVIGCTASDAKVKRDMNPFFGGLAFLRNVQPETFRYLNSTQYADGGQLHLGFVAQNLQQANPLFASRMGNGLLQPEQLAIQAASVSAIKELDAKITQLTALVEKQQAEINRLRRHRR